MSRFFSGRATSTQIIRRSDGTLEKRQTFRDSEGNEQTTVTRQIGDKMHEIITKRDKTGAETKTENLINMDESKKNGFSKDHYLIVYLIVAFRITDKQI